MKKFKLILAVLATVVFFTSCEKEGPEGPQGPQGPQGQTGEAPISDLNYYVTTDSWDGPLLMTNGGNAYLHDIYTSLITADIKDNGVVLVYRKISYSSGGYSWSALPYSEVFDYNTTRLWGFEVFTGCLRIIVQNTDNLDHNYGSSTFRIVTISGSRLAEHKNIDLNNFNEVKQAFHLSE